MAKDTMTAETAKAAAILGRLGGLANTEAQREARARNGKRGGRPPRYQLAVRRSDDGSRLLIDLRDDEGLDSAALIFLGRWLAAQTPRRQIAALAHGEARLVPASRAEVTTGRRYRVTVSPGGRRLTLEIRQLDRQYVVAPAIDASALNFLGRWLHKRRRDLGRVTAMDGGVIAMAPGK